MASPRESYYPAVCVRACARLCRIVSNVVNKSELGCVWRREYQFGMMRPQRNDGDSGRLTSAAPSAGRANGQSFPISSFLYSFSSSSFLQMRPLLPCAQSVGKYSLAMRAKRKSANKILAFFLIWRDVIGPAEQIGVPDEALEIKNPRSHDLTDEPSFCTTTRKATKSQKDLARVVLSNSCEGAKFRRLPANQLGAFYFSLANKKEMDRRIRHFICNPWWFNETGKSLRPFPVYWQLSTSVGNISNYQPVVRFYIVLSGIN